MQCLLHHVAGFAAHPQVLAVSPVHTRVYNKPSVLPKPGSSSPLPGIVQPFALNSAKVSAYRPDGGRGAKYMAHCQHTRAALLQSVQLNPRNFRKGVWFPVVSRGINVPSAIAASERSTKAGERTQVNGDIILLWCQPHYHSDTSLEEPSD
eukprot:GHVS01034050.1.p1 GENE.GHVS01034050.1~~GHVS01034050.1.p1  ORF type:complete len:151 (-),score=10.57 GHVS01034050.1:592-1044(-)